MIGIGAGHLAFCSRLATAIYESWDKTVEILEQLGSAVGVIIIVEQLTDKAFT